MDNYDDLLVKIGILKTILGALRQNHYVCEDGWYSCPKTKDYFGPEDKNVCTCGADATNTLIDATLEETK